MKKLVDVEITIKYTVPMLIENDRESTLEKIFENNEVDIANWYDRDLSFEVYTTGYMANWAEDANVFTIEGDWLEYDDAQRIVKNQKHDW